MHFDIGTVLFFLYLSVLIIFGCTIAVLKRKCTSRLVAILQCHSAQLLEEIGLGKYWWLRSASKYPLKILVKYAKSERLNGIPGAKPIMSRLVMINRLYLMWAVLFLIFVLIGVFTQILS